MTLRLHVILYLCITDPDVDHNIKKQKPGFSHISWCVNSVKEEPVTKSMTVEMRQLIILLMQCEGNIEPSRGYAGVSLSLAKTELNASWVAYSC